MAATFRLAMASDTFSIERRNTLSLSLAITSL